MPVSLRSLFLIPLGLGLSACTSPTHLLHYQRTVLGFDAAVATQEGRGHIIFGYDRRMVAVVPKTTLEQGEVDAMSIISCTNVKTSGISSGFAVDFDERLATGDAAQQYARALGASTADSGFNCVREQEETAP